MFNTYVLSLGFICAALCSPLHDSAMNMMHTMAEDTEMMNDDDKIDDKMSSHDNNAMMHHQDETNSHDDAMINHDGLNSHDMELINQFSYEERERKKTERDHNSAMMNHEYTVNQEGTAEDDSDVMNHGDMMNHSGTGNGESEMMNHEHMENHDGMAEANVMNNGGVVNHSGTGDGESEMMNHQEMGDNDSEAMEHHGDMGDHHGMIHDDSGDEHHSGHNHNAFVISSSEINQIMHDPVRWRQLYNHYKNKMDCHEGDRETIKEWSDRCILVCDKKNRPVQLDRVKNKNDVGLGTRELRMDNTEEEPYYGDNCTSPKTIIKSDHYDYIKICNESKQVEVLSNQYSVCQGKQHIPPPDHQYKAENASCHAHDTQTQGPMSMQHGSHKKMSTDIKKEICSFFFCCNGKVLSFTETCDFSKYC